MALQSYHGEIIDLDLPPASQSGGLSLDARLTRIENAINRVDDHVNQRLNALERRTLVLEAPNPARLIEEFRDLQSRMGKLENEGSRNTQVAIAKVEKLEDKVTALDRSTWSKEQVQAALGSYRRWLIGTLIAFAGLALVVFTSVYSVRLKP